MEVDLPKRPDGKYLDRFAFLHDDDEKLLEQYFKRIREVYKIDAFELVTEKHGTLKFHREFIASCIERVSEENIMYCIYDENTEYLSGKITGTILINKKGKTFRIQISNQEYSVQIERQGLATEIWKKAKQIMKLIGIEDCKGYTIYTMVDEATAHLMEKYGNPFEKLPTPDEKTEIQKKSGTTQGDTER